MKVFQRLVSFAFVVMSLVSMWNGEWARSAMDIGWAILAHLWSVEAD